MIGGRGAGCAWRSEDTFVESILSFNLYVGSGIYLRLPGLQSKCCLYLLSRLAGPLRKCLGCSCFLLTRHKLKYLRRGNHS